MYENIHIGIQNLRKPTAIKPGGLCTIYFVPIDDVQTWPSLNALTGCIEETLVLKEGSVLFIVEATQKERTLREVSKRSAAGDYVETTITTSLPGNILNHILGIGAMANRHFALIVKDINGEQRLIGNEDRGAAMTWQYTSGDRDSSRYRNLVWSYSHSLAAPVYDGGSVTLDNENFIFASLVFVVRFRVGAVGSPMNEGDTVYSHPLLANGNFIIFSGGKAIHQISDDPEDRYASKPFASNTITIHGGVYDEEVIEIYKF